MAKRPSIVDEVMSAPKAAPAAAMAAEAPASAAARPVKPRPDVQHSSVYIPRAAYDRLREIAFSERRKLHDLLMEGVDHVIEKRGHPERATRSTTAR